MAEMAGWFLFAWFPLHWDKLCELETILSKPALHSVVKDTKLFGHCFIKSALSLLSVVDSLLLNLIGLTLWDLCEEIYLKSFALHIVLLLKKAIAFYVCWVLLCFDHHYTCHCRDISPWIYSFNKGVRPFNTQPGFNVQFVLLSCVSPPFTEGNGQVVVAFF